MHYPAGMVEDELRRLYEIPFFIPPGPDRITLLSAYLVGHRERQSGRHLFSFVPDVMACRHDPGAEIGKRLKAFSVAV